MEQHAVIHRHHQQMHMHGHHHHHRRLNVRPKTVKLSLFHLKSRSNVAASRNNGLALHGSMVTGGSRGFSLNPKRINRVCSGLFQYRDQGHLHYYHAYNREGFVRCKGGTESLEKKLKLMKSLSKDLSTSSRMGFANDFLAQANTFQEAAQGLIQQLQELRAKEKELNRQKKEEKRAKLKSSNMMDSESSSSSSESSSESSDSDGEMIYMSRLGHEVASVVQPDPLQLTQLPLTSTAVVLPTRDLNAGEADGFLCNTPTHFQNETAVRFTDNISSLTGQSLANKIEVCMGNRCKKSGAVALLDEFQRVLGAEATVVGCKCMGKCRDGPNVRVTYHRHLDDSVTSTPSNRLCIGIGLEDVNVIVANLSGEDKPFGPVPAASS